MRIRLLGGFAAEVDGAVVDERSWRLRKARTLVKIVALAPGRRAHREVVAELLWPERDGAAAANNLHQALHAARRALGDPATLTLVDDVVALTPGAWVDVDAFEAAADAGDPEAALALYRGELLPEDRFEEWTAGRRAALRELQLDLLVQAADRLTDAGDPAAAIAALARAAADAPRHEPVRRALMRTLAEAGRRQDALAQFEELRDALRAHNEADPDPETRALYRRLLADSEPAAPARGGLPTHLTSFVGRERELAELGRLLDRTRLVTLTGPGGAGKTRLALQAAAARTPALADGAWLVDLGPLRDPALVAQSVATAIGVPIPANRPALDAVVARLARTPGILIVLDTCEHLLDSCAHVAEALLAAGPGVRLLATSREPLRCAAEVAWRVPSLVEAPALFRERAAAVAPAAAAGWTDQDGALIEEICFRLDRMPLAVELAAARTGALTLPQIAARLTGALDVLTAGARTALTRQQTLRATIDWSHELLDDEERALFRRLAIFAGGFGLEAAEAVGADGTAIPGRRVADLVARLVDKSLVVADDGRFRFVDTIRQFADEQLTASGERDAVAGRHLAWCLALARENDPTLVTGGRPLRTLEAEHDNLRAALSFGLKADPEAALALATHLWRFWLDRSWFVEGTAWMDAVLSAAQEPTALRVEALLAAAGLALRRGDPDTYLRRLDETLTVHDELDDPAAAVSAQVQQALFEAYINASDRSAQLSGDALATAERLGRPDLAANASQAAALAAWQRSDIAGATTMVEATIERLRALPAHGERFFDALTFAMPPQPEGAGGTVRLVWEATMFPFRRLDATQALGLALNNLAWAMRSVGADGRDPRGALDEALGRFRAAGDPSGEALTLAHLGHLARTRGDHDHARAKLEAALALRQELGERRDAGLVMLGLALVDALDGDMKSARATFAAALRRFEATDDLPAMAGTRMNWAIAEERAGDLPRARDLYAEAAALWGAQRLPRAAAWSAVGHAAALDSLGDRDGARAVRTEARATFATLGDPLGQATLDAQEPLPDPR